jgi:uncharacterized protein with HEPN domain
MPSENDQSWLLDIKANIGLAREFIGNRSFEEFSANKLAFYATTRALEIISEASKHLSKELKKRHSSIDWIAIRDAGNVYRHAYEYVTEERIWDTATTSLVDLEVVVLEELARF